VYTRDIAVRRYFPAFVEAWKLIGLLRSFQAQDNEFIQLGFADLAITSSLFGPVFMDSIGRNEDENSETARAVEEISRRAGDPVTGEDLAKYLDISYDRAAAEIRKAVEAGTIIRSNQPESRHSDLAGHAIAGFEQRPIETLPVERDDDWVFRDSLSQCKQQRALLAVLPHEQLFNLKSPTFPPCNAHEKRICAAPT